MKIARPLLLLVLVLLLTGFMRAGLQVSFAGFNVIDDFGNLVVDDLGNQVVAS